ncbi:MAG: ATP-dependent helicase [Cyclobacteriaceae bacterium]
MKEHYQESFNQVLESLNEGQKQAVETIEGPVLVVAGPGTGKTQILAARIGKILQETDAACHNILCLTYTDAGTIAMRKRLEQFIGPEAYNVNIFTFHAFCNQVIQENLDYFGVRGLQAISDLEKVDLLIDLIDKFDGEHTLKRWTGEVYYESSRLAKLFQFMKAENWSAVYIETVAKEYLEDLPHRESYQYKRANSKKGIVAGDPKTADIEKQAEKMKKLVAAAKEFNQFESLKLKAKRYDFDDMILKVLHAFQNEESILRRYQERYLYFLVDEYQDTNGSQNQLLQLLSDYWETPNIFVVGDDDQAIYRFQGANIKNITDFYDRYAKDLSLVVLKDNYRSQQAILDASGAVINNNQERLTKLIPNLNKQLTSHTNYTQNELRLLTYPTIFQEEIGILQDIKEKHKNGTAFADIAIIYRNHQQVENMVKLLQIENIPVNIKRRDNILDIPMTRHIITIFRYLTLEAQKADSGEYLLFEMMHYPYFGIESTSASGISRGCSRTKERGRLPWRKLMASKKEMKALGIESVEEISRFHNLLSFWMEDQFDSTIQMLLEKILTKGKILDFCMNSPERSKLVKIITSFFDFIKEESAKDPTLKIADLVEMTDKMIKNKIRIMVNQWSQSDDGLNLVTAHSAKGLEYDYVYILGASADKWEKKRSPPSTYSFPDTLVSANPENKEEEERRLFFVAMTRAKKGLTVSYALQTNEGKALDYSRFVAELKEHGIETESRTLSDDTLSTYSLQLMANHSLEETPWLDTNLADQVLKSFKMSVTSLNKYLRCPTAFYFENVIQVPSARNASMGFGSAVHYALELFFKDMLNQYKGKQFPPKEQLVTRFQEGIQLYRSHFTDKELESRLEYAEKILPAYYEQYVENWNKVVVLEYDVSTALLQHVPLSGKLDKLEFDGFNVNVVDYKTGKPANGLKKMKGPTDRKPDGEDYWRQIVFYKILMDNDKRQPWEMISGEMDFIEQNDKKTYSKEKYIPSLEDIEIVKEQIIKSYDSIQHHEFSNGCKEENCSWCTFVKEHFNGE